MVALANPRPARRAAIPTPAAPPVPPAPRALFARTLTDAFWRLDCTLSEVYAVTGMDDVTTPAALRGELVGPWDFHVFVWSWLRAQAERIGASDPAKAEALEVYADRLLVAYVRCAFEDAEFKAWVRAQQAAQRAAEGGA